MGESGGLCKDPSEGGRQQPVRGGLECRSRRVSPLRCFAAWLCARAADRRRGKIAAAPDRAAKPHPCSEPPVVLCCHSLGPSRAGALRAPHSTATSADHCYRARTRTLFVSAARLTRLTRSPSRGLRECTPETPPPALPLTSATCCVVRAEPFAVRRTHTSSRSSVGALPSQSAGCPPTNSSSCSAEEAQTVAAPLSTRMWRLDSLHL